jgi:hypothetical protein
MTGREMLAWVAVGLAAIAFVCSLVLNRHAKAALAETEGEELAARQLTTRLHIGCLNAFSFAKSALASPPGQHQRERALVAAHAAQVCLDERARAELRKKVILLEISDDQEELARDLASDVARRTGEVLKKRHDRTRREEEEFDRREREEAERELREGLR